MFKNIILFVTFLCIGLINVLGFSYAQNLDVMNLTKIDNRVVDYSNTLDQTSLENLNTKAQQLQEQTQTQLAVALIPHRQGNELIDIGLKLFRDAGLGSAEKNNGVLLVISTEEKKLRIIVGYGLEGDLPDVLVKQIIEENIRPLVNQGDFAGAVNAYLDAVPQHIGEDAKGGLQQASTGELSFMLLMFGFFLGFFVGEMIEAMNMQQKISQKFSITKILPYLFPFGGILFLLFTLGIAQHIWLGVGTIVGGIFSYFIDVQHPRWNDGGYRGGRSSGGFSSGGGFGGGFNGFGGSSGGGGAGD